MMKIMEKAKLSFILSLSMMKIIEKAKIKISVNEISKEYSDDIYMHYVMS